MRPATPSLTSSRSSSLRAAFCLAEGTAFLNHGSFGATPRVVLEAQQAFRDRLEAHPVRFLDRERPALLRAAADRLGAFLGARGDDLVFIGNATSAVNAVLRSRDLGPGDEILTLDHVYPGVQHTVDYVCARTGAVRVAAHVPFPIGEDGPDRVVQAVTEALSERTRIAVLDHITSASGLVLPIDRMIAACRERGVPVLVDGAHAPGQIDLHVAALGADWYTGNLHKWAFAPKGTAFLWSGPDRPRPHVISNYSPVGWPHEFDYTGTRDVTGWCSVPAALDFYATVPDLRARNHALANESADRIAAVWGTPRPAPISMIGSMVALAAPDHVEAVDQPAAVALRNRLADEADVDVAVFSFRQRPWIRISAQLYTVPADFDRLADALRPS